MSEPDELSKMADRLDELLKTGNRQAWATLRRLRIVAPCCPRFTLVEVLSTTPECVRVRQVNAGHIRAGDPDRRRWSGVRSAGLDTMWLSAFQRMAEAGSKQMVFCKHGRWWIHASDIVTRQGRYVLSQSDKCR